jgi:hypothetical protein
MTMSSNPDDYPGYVGIDPSIDSPSYAWWMEPEVSTDDYWESSYLDTHYTGAPDECNIHWPEKLPCKTCQDIERGTG